MIIYNVTLKVDKSVADDWVKWMKTVHIPEVMNLGLFTDNRFCHILEQDEHDGITYSAQYVCEGMEQYETYINLYAKDMRDKGFKEFGNKFIAFRSIMETI